MASEETLTASNEIEVELNRLVMLTEGFGIFVERELTTRRIKDKLLREMIVKTHADRMEQVKEQRAKLLRIFDPERRALERAVIEAAHAINDMSESFWDSRERWVALSDALAALDDAPVPDQGARER